MVVSQTQCGYDEDGDDDYREEGSDFSTAPTSRHHHQDENASQSLSIADEGMIRVRSHLRRKSTPHVDGAKKKRKVV